MNGGWVREWEEVVVITNYAEDVEDEEDDEARGGHGSSTFGSWVAITASKL